SPSGGAVSHGVSSHVLELSAQIWVSVGIGDADAVAAPATVTPPRSRSATPTAGIVVLRMILSPSQIVLVISTIRSGGPTPRAAAGIWGSATAIRGMPDPGSARDGRPIGPRRQPVDPPPGGPPRERGRQRGSRGREEGPGGQAETARVVARPSS